MKPNITLFAGLIVSAIACQDTLDTEVQPIIDGEFSGKAGETVVSENQDNLELPFDFLIVNIQESRCPTSVTCVRLGEVMVSTHLRFTDQSQFIDYDLCLGDCPQIGNGPVINDTLDVFQRDAGYRIILKEVTPYPEMPGATPGQTAVFSITRL